MYKFCDTTEIPQVTPLPAEAVSFDGYWLDNEIPGFRTLSVEGREFVTRNIDTYTVGNTDGAYYRGSAFQPRTITVQYQIIARDPYEFREAFNKLNTLLRSTQARLIFADEADKYFVATRASYGSVPTGRNAVTGTIAFLCADPKKYSVKEKEVVVSAESGDVLISLRNNGNMAVPISYDIRCDSDNGYVGIENGEDYIRFGTEEEEDGIVEDVAEKLTSIQNLINCPDDAPEGITMGSLGIIDLEGRTWVQLVNAGTGSSWHGAKRTFQIPADKNGTVGAVNFEFYSYHWFQCAFLNQKSRQTLKFIDSTGRSVCTLQISKTGTSNAASTVKHYVNGELKRTFDFECGADPKSNPFLLGQGHNGVKKSGGTIQLYFFGKYYTYYDEELEDVAVTQIQWTAYDYGTEQRVTRNYIGSCDLTKTDVESWNDVRNRYNAGDSIEVNGYEGKLYVNGIPKLGDEIKGSEYFHAEPGQNSISVHCSKWATGITVKARIREAWI